MKYKQLERILYKELRIYLQMERLSLKKMYEIRIRIGQPVILYYNGREVITPLITSEKHLKESMDYICQYSVYAYENELKQGFITIEGGHRVGVAGQVLMENGAVKRMNYVSSINIRISHEVIGCADQLFPHICKNETICNTLLISAPRCGKTTLLRDAIRQISDGNVWIQPHTIGVIDERSELAACYHGIPQNKIGMRSDVLDACQKTQGMLMLIRSMSPKVIAMDEIGAKDDVMSIGYAMRCGVKILATIHGESMDEIKEKPYVRELLQEKVFERYVVLKQNSIGKIEAIYDEEQRVCC